MKLMFLLVTMVLVSCGQQIIKKETPRKVYKVHAEIEPYVAQFQNLAIQTSHPAPIQHLVAEFKDLTFLGVDVIGVCYYPEGGNGTPIIQLDPEFWQNGERPEVGHISALDPSEIKAAREFLVFHELGHCRLGEDHRDGLAYPSIMNTIALGAIEYLEDYDFLVNELFDPPTYNLSKYVIISSNNYLYDPHAYASHIEPIKDRIFIYKPQALDKIIN